jgi:hypothetical protein
MVLPLALAVSGCAHHERDGFNNQGFSPLPANTANQTARPPVALSAPSLIITPETRVSGKVAMVNTGGRFVVLNFPIGHLPAIDQQLNIYHGGLKVGEVKVCGPQRDDNIVGDITKGSAQVGDEVREQ